MNRSIALFLILSALCLSVASCAGVPTVADTEAASPLSDDAEVAKARTVIEKAPDSPIGYTQLASVYLKRARETGDFAISLLAEPNVRRALELAPNDASARKLEAALHLANHRFAEAVAASKKIIAEYPADPFAYGVLSDAYVETGDYKAAIEAAQKMIDLRPNTASFARVGQLRSLHGDHKGAVEMFTEAARISDPNDRETRAWCLVQLGDELWKHGKYPEAEKVYDEALAIFPGYFLASVSKGRVRASLGDLTTAERILSDAGRIVPNAKALLLLADIADVQGNSERAKNLRDQYEQMEIKLGDAADHNGFGFFMADNGKLDQATALANDEFAKEPNIKSAHLLAWCLYKNGNAAEARKYIKEAMRLGTTDAAMLFHAGMIAKADGDLREARQLLSQSLKLNPGFDLLKAREAQRALSELKG